MKIIAAFLLVCTVSLGRSFTGTYGLGNDLGEVRAESLDIVPFVFPLEALRYPDELRGSGIIGRIGVIASVTKEGTVHWAIATHGNDDRFRVVVQYAVSKWRFSVPRQNSKAVAAYVNFTVVVSESRAVEIIFPSKKEPNQAPEPTAPSGRGSA